MLQTYYIKVGSDKKQFGHPVNFLRAPIIDYSIQKKASIKLRPFNEKYEKNYY